MTRHHLELTACGRRSSERLAARNHWRCVREACLYIDAHLGDVLRMEILCRVTGVSERTIETAFHEVTGMGPLQFIRVRRLNAARHTLNVADPGATTVKIVALEAGFRHFGYFARRYKAHFGESPSQTLGAEAPTLAK